MDQIWAPWRMAYVGNGHMDDDKCVFCHAVEHADDPALQVLDLDRHTIALMNKYPYSNGHFMVAPRRHVEQVENLSPAERLAIMDKLALGVQVLKGALQANGINSGFNLGRAAGAGIPGHLHLHLVPRWTNDVNFMTVLADVRVIPEHIETTYQKLKTSFAQLG